MVLCKLPLRCSTVIFRATRIGCHTFAIHEVTDDTSGFNLCEDVEEQERGEDTGSSLYFHWVAHLQAIGVLTAAYEP
jgi:hypothetical protein